MHLQQFKLKISKLAFPGNANGCVDTTTKRYIVQRVENLREDVRIEGAIPRKWPRPNWNKQNVGLRFTYSTNL